MMLAGFAVRNKRGFSIDRKKSADDYFANVIITPQGFVRVSRQDFEDRELRLQLFLRRRADLERFTGATDPDMKILKQEKVLSFRSSSLFS